jgi:hypothetical protein
MLTLAFIFELCSGVIGLVWLILTIYVVFKVLTSNATGTTKLLWLIAIFFLPILGPVLWLLLGNKT